MSLIVIFGLTTKEKAKPAGEFHCPTCDTQRTYAELRRSRWFSLFFIPVIPLASRSLGRIRCTVCGSEFDPDMVT